MVIVLIVLVIIGTYMLGTLRTYLLEQKKLEVLTRANVIASVQIDGFDEIAIEQKMESMPVEVGFRAMILDSQSRVYYDSYSEGSYRGKLYIYAPVTEVLLSGNHGKIKQWRREKALEITVEKRPDLLDKK